MNATVICFQTEIDKRRARAAHNYLNSMARVYEGLGHAETAASLRVSAQIKQAELDALSRVPGVPAFPG